MPTVQKHDNVETPYVSKTGKLDFTEKGENANGMKAKMTDSEFRLGDLEVKS